MKETPGTLQTGGSPFATTHWSVVIACAQGNEVSSGAGQAALTQLCRDYWPPLYSFVRRRGYRPHDAQDLVQGFFAHLIENRAFARADQTKGRFRAFLLTSLKHYLADAWDHQRRDKRGGGQPMVFLDHQFDAVEAQCARAAMESSPVSEERLFERRWAAELTGRALAELEREEGWRGAAKTRAFREFKPFLQGGANLPTQEEVAARLGVPRTTLRSYLSRLRARYREILRAEVARTVAKAEDVDEELRHLRRVLIAEC